LSLWKMRPLKRTAPVAASRQTAKKSCPSTDAVVSQMRPSRTTGVDQPLCGIGVFQATLWVSLHSTGSRPAPFGT